ncbi:cell wall-active antibiotics response protein LiaF [Bacillus sp. T33-2]|uniref:cell wall-active antibiotics response protein LiaF n=1 Tax=Bacillus sp. T33-2 TaxID=2054168 RepID=UPI000C78EB6F|nr:cell wall-active antibiotics response protein LiaF [Bacillus sp. T33-2]PLR96075.1 cell wall-active antibiotics response protein [Bacillus sp. T33-2]
MLSRLKNDYISWIALTGAVLLLLELAFFNNGLIFSLLVTGSAVYFGRRMMPRTLGKLLFWGGLFFLATSILGMITFRFFLLAILINIILHFAGSKKNPEIIHPVIKETDENGSKNTIVKRPPLLENIFFGRQKTPDHVYEWNDVNIQAGVGDSVIDLSLTVLPKGETVIFIRNIIGNVKVFIPYDLEVTVRHSSLAGSTSVLDYQESKILNQTLFLQTPDYDQAEQKVKIFTSMLIGDLEVKRI